MVKVSRADDTKDTASRQRLEKLLSKFESYWRKTTGIKKTNIKKVSRKASAPAPRLVIKYNKYKMNSMGIAMDLTRFGTFTLGSNEGSLKEYHGKRQNEKLHNETLNSGHQQHNNI